MSAAPPTPTTERHLRVPTRLGELHVRLIGDGPTAVLWPSMFVDGSTWDRIVLLLPGRLLVVVDGPGLGRSESLRRSSTIAAAAGAALDLLTGLRERGLIDGPMDWVGNAFGGHVGYELAVMPGVLRSLVAVSAPLEPIPSGVRRQIAVLRPVLRMLGPIGPVRDAVVSAMLTEASAADPEIRHTVTASLARPTRASMSLAVRSFILNRIDVTALLPTMDLPALFVAGDDRGDWAPQHARRAAAQAPRATAVTVAGSRTLVPLEQPAALPPRSASSGRNWTVGSSTGHDEPSRRGDAGRPDPGGTRRGQHLPRVPGVGRGTGHHALPDPGRGGRRDRLRREPDPRHPDRLRARAWSRVAAHFAALAHHRRSYYTAPIKALVSEKFFALCEIFGAVNVGMVTGDASINPDAPIVCATAEIVANIALRGGAGRRHRPGRDGRVPLLLRPGPRLGVAGADHRTAAGAVRADVGHARRRHVLPGRPDPPHRPVHRAGGERGTSCAAGVLLRADADRRHHQGPGRRPTRHRCTSSTSPRRPRWNVPRRCSARRWPPGRRRTASPR